jgi:TPR repeat protein
MIASHSLGVAYELGHGVPIDLPKAFAYYKTSAERGYLLGLVDLGRCHRDGVGTTKDAKAAVGCFHAASFRGEASAQEQLANCYRQGIGVAQDLVEAFAFLNLAADKSESARASLAELERLMTAEQKTAGQRRAKDLHAEITASSEAKPLEYR